VKDAALVNDASIVRKQGVTSRASAIEIFPRRSDT